MEDLISRKHSEVRQCVSIENASMLSSSERHIFITFDFVVVFAVFLWLDRGWPHDVEEESEENTASTVDLGNVGVTPTAKVASAISFGDTWDEGVLALPHEGEQGHEEHTEPLPNVEVNEHEVETEGDTSVGHVVMGWVPCVMNVVGIRVFHVGG